MALDDFHTGEQRRQEGADEFFHRQETDGRHLRIGAVDSDEPVDVVGHLHPREVLTAVVGGLHRDREVEAQPADERERVGGIHGQRRQNGEDLIVEVLRQGGAIGVGEFVPAHEGDAVAGQRRADRLHEDLGVPGGQLLGAFTDQPQLLARGQPVGRPDRQAHLVAALEAGDPHHVELVEVGGEDGQELGPLQQRQRGVGGQCEHPGVEVQPAQLAVEVAILGQRVVDRRCGGRRRRLRGPGLGLAVGPRHPGSDLRLSHIVIIPHRADEWFVAG